MTNITVKCAQPRLAFVARLRTEHGFLFCDTPSEALRAKLDVRMLLESITTIFPNAVLCMRVLVEVALCHARAHT